MWRARLIAVVMLRWCRAQFPEIRRGMIFPRSVVKYLSVRGSLYSIRRLLSAQKRHTLRRPKLRFGLGAGPAEGGPAA